MSENSFGQVLVPVSHFVALCRKAFPGFVCHLVAFHYLCFKKKCLFCYDFIFVQICDIL